MGVSAPELACQGQPEADVYLAVSLEADIQTRRRLMRLLGAVAVEGSTSAEQAAAEQASLVAVVEDYFSDDPERATNGHARLRADLKSNTFEILRASGHVSQSRSVRRADGFYQHGYSQRAMYAHGTFHTDHPVEHRRRTAEVLNELRIEEGADAGRFRTHYFVEESRAPSASEMPDEIARKMYDVKTHTAMWRVTTVDDMGNRITFVAPVSGVDKAGHLHDAEGVRNVRRTLGAELVDADPTTGLENAFWVSKKSLPNGITDILRLHDEGIGGNAFCGVEGIEGNYDTLVEESLWRERQAERNLDAKVHELARALQGFKQDVDCVEALKVMGFHAKDFAAELCIGNSVYDAAQFGPAAALHIENARRFAKQGNLLAAEQALVAAKATAVVYMCGMRVETEQPADGLASSVDKADLGDCDFVSKECPQCHRKNVKTSARKGVYVGKCGCRSDRPVSAETARAA